MSDKTKKTISVVGAVLVGVGTGGILLAGGDVGSAEGIVGLAASLFAAVAALINGFKE